MHLRFRSLSAFTLAASLVVALAPDVGAQGKNDKEAMKLHDQAMNEDYLNVAFDKAEKKLKDALKKCGKDGCSPTVLGKIHIALATVYGVGLSKMDLAKEELVAALKADPKAALDESLKTPELDKAYQDAKKQVGADGGEGGKTGGGEPSGGEPSGDEPKKPAGDISHTPTAEQAVNYPVPIYVEIPEELDAQSVTLRYKPFGGTKWKSLEMKKVGDGWGVEIPCEDVTTTGDIKYYIIAKDADGNPAGTAGSLKDPYKVPIKNDLDGDPPSLPGKKPPDKCAVKEDCPPGLPGCPDASGGARGDKGWGASCENTQECQAGLVCLNGSCEEGTEQPSGNKTSKGPKNIISASGQFDILLINGAEDVCSGRDSAYVCFLPDDGGQFYGVPADKNGTNGIQGGFGFASVRPLLGYDRVLVDVGPGSISAGLRLGWAFGGSPSSDEGPPREATDKDGEKTRNRQANAFLPFHAELRGTFTLGGGPLELNQVRPYFFVGGGLAQVNAGVNVSVCDRLDEDGNTIGQPGATEEPSSSCPDDEPSKLRKDLEAYQITGLNFVGVGAGAMYALTDQLGIAAELKVMFMIPTFGIVFAPTIGPVFGF